jgi:hypothetical protein
MEGSTQIGKHTLYCMVSAIVYSNDVNILGSVSHIAQASEVPIEPNGDTQTDRCIAPTPRVPMGKARCADITLVVMYELSTQPNVSRRKSFRFVASENTDFVWDRQPCTPQELIAPNLCSIRLPSSVISSVVHFEAN